MWATWPSDINTTCTKNWSFLTFSVKEWLSQFSRFPKVHQNFAMLCWLGSHLWTLVLWWKIQSCGLCELQRVHGRICNSCPPIKLEYWQKKRNKPNYVCPLSKEAIMYAASSDNGIHNSFFGQWAYIIWFVSFSTCHVQLQCFQSLLRTLLRTWLCQMDSPY